MQIRLRKKSRTLLALLLLLLQATVCILNAPSPATLRECSELLSSSLTSGKNGKEPAPLARHNVHGSADDDGAKGVLPSNPYQIPHRLWDYFQLAIGYTKGCVKIVKAQVPAKFSFSNHTRKPRTKTLSQVPLLRGQSFERDMVNDDLRCIKAFPSGRTVVYSCETLEEVGIVDVNRRTIVGIVRLPDSVTCLVPIDRTDFLCGLTSGKLLRIHRDTLNYTQAKFVHQAEVMSIAVHPRERALALSVSRDNFLCAWNLTTMSVTHKVPCAEGTSSILWSPSGNLFSISSEKITRVIEYGGRVIGEIRHMYISEGSSPAVKFINDSMVAIGGFGKPLLYELPSPLDIDQTMRSGEKMEQDCGRPPVLSPSSRVVQSVGLASEMTQLEICRCLNSTRDLLGGVSGQGDVVFWDLDTLEASGWISATDGRDSISAALPNCICTFPPIEYFPGAIVEKFRFKGNRTGKHSYAPPDPPIGSGANGVYSKALFSEVLPVNVGGARKGVKYRRGDKHERYRRNKNANPKARQKRNRNPFSLVDENKYQRQDSMARSSKARRPAQRPRSKNKRRSIS